MIFFYIYITIDNIFLYIFLKILVILIFVVIILVQFYVILVRNGMFYSKNRSSNLITIFYCVIDTMYIYSWKKIIKIWPILVIQLNKSRCFFNARVHTKYSEVCPPCPFTISFLIQISIIHDNISSQVSDKRK